MRERKRAMVILTSFMAAIVLIIVGVICVVVHEKKVNKVAQNSTSQSQSVTDYNENETDSESETDSIDISTMKPTDTENTEETQLPEDDPNNLTGETVEDSPYYITVNRTQNIVIIYTKDKKGNYTVPYKAMICSVGIDNKTPTGEFTTSVKWRWAVLSGNVYGQYVYRFKNAYLFHSVPYYNTNGGSLETEEYNKLGEPASKGCVRLTVEDAKWLIDNVPSGTKVKVYDSDKPEPLKRPEAVKIDLKSPNKGWDPTDPNKNNPWLKTPPAFEVVDTNVTVTGDIINVEAGSEFKLENAIKAKDYRNRDVKVSITAKDNKHKLSLYVPDDYIYTCTATDLKGNSIKKDYTIRVKDTTPPEVVVSADPYKLTTDMYVDSSKVKEYLLANLVITDNAGPDAITTELNENDLQKVISGIASGKKGSQAVRYTVKDSKNRVTGSMTVEFLDISISASADVFTFELDMNDKTEEEVRKLFTQNIVVTKNPDGVATSIEFTNFDFEAILNHSLTTINYKVTSSISSVKEITGRFDIIYQESQQTDETESTQE